MRSSPSSERPVARSIATLAPGGIRAIAGLVSAELDTVNLLFGEPDFDMPGHIAEAVASAVARGDTRYAPGRGLGSLREAVAEAVSRRSSRLLTVEDVTVSAGGVQALFAALRTLLDPGDGVLIPDPGWPNYAGQCALLGLRALPYSLLASDDFSPRVEQLDAAVAAVPGGSRVRAIIINTPSNPTGAVWSRRAVEEVVAFAQRHDLWIISDEVYDEMVFDGVHHSAASLDPDRTIVVGSFSKTYAMTGLRVGYLLGPAYLGPQFGKVLELEASCAATPSQWGALAALTGSQACVDVMRDAYASRRDLAVSALKSSGMFSACPSGAFYVMADVSAANIPSGELAKQLVTAPVGVACAPGQAFGRQASSLLRLSLAAAPSAIEEGIARIASAIGVTTTDT